MPEPSISAGARPPLFDRLNAPEAGRQNGGVSSGAMDRRLLQQSILDELSRLFSSRSPSLPESIEAGGTVLNYGMPDLLLATPGRDVDHQQIAGIIQRRVTMFEPRLANVRVTVTPSPGDARALQIVLSASLRISRGPQPISLPLELDRGGARLRLAQAADHDGEPTRHD
jgi:type VI secretion system protein ImpF